jgi:hypothetical protein
MRKLYGSFVDVKNNYKESNITEIPENIFSINGYSVGDRLLEDVMFDIQIVNGTINSVSCRKEDLDYFEDLNQSKWLEAVRKYANRILESGDEVDVPDYIKKKYKHLNVFAIA